MIETSKEFVSKIENFFQISASEKIDFFVYYHTVIKGENGIEAKAILDFFDELRIPPYSNIPQYLSTNSKRSKGKVQKFIKKGTKYLLTNELERNLKSKIQLDLPKIIIENKLRGLALKVSNVGEKDFLNEAIKTFEVEAYRASIIMVWLLTLNHLYEYVLIHKLGDFITALRRMNNNKTITVKDDFGDIKESTFIEACRGANIISNDVKKILDTKLGIRNSFAHPSTVSLPKSKALEFIEDLIENVILKY